MLAQRTLQHVTFLLLFAIFRLSNCFHLLTLALIVHGCPQTFTHFIVALEIKALASLHYSVLHSCLLQTAFPSFCTNVNVTSSEFGLSGLITMWMSDRNFEDADEANWHILLVRSWIASAMLNFKRAPGPMTGKATVRKCCSSHKSKHLSSPFSSAYKTTSVIKIISTLKKKSFMVS